MGLNFRSQYLYNYKPKRKNYMFIAKLVSVSTFLSFLLISNVANAENFNIEMLNKLGKERMVYSEKVISIKVNDEITWKSVDKGHNVEFIGMPAGVSKYKSKISKDAKFKFTKPGIYLYQCTPHKAMGMIGLVIVGNDKSNLDKIKKVKVYGIGIGTEGDAFLPYRVGNRVMKQRIPGGNIDHGVLGEISRVTNGKYFKATSEKALSNIFNEINKLETSSVSINSPNLIKYNYKQYLIVGFFILLLCVDGSWCPDACCC